MKQKKARVDNRIAPRQSVAAHFAAQSSQGWGLRWNAGRFRVALWLIVLAIGVVITFGQHGSALAQLWLADGYVATRATVVKAPFWADALEPKPANADYSDAVAGWHIELRVGEHPFTLAVALTDFDPNNNYTDQKIVPDAKRFAVDSVHPVWFYDDNKRKQPETVALLERPPALLISRAAFGRFPSLMEAMENSVELLIAPGILLSLAALYLIASVWGKRGGNTAGASFAARAGPAFFAIVIAIGIYMLNNEHPLARENEQYSAAEIEITNAPFPSDQLTYYNGYRVLWRTWRVQAKLTTPGAQEFTIDVDGLDPHRATWASRHSPDFAAFQPGTRMPVWQSSFHGSNLKHIGPMKPVIYWETFFSRERWPEKYTPRDFVKDSPVAVAAIAVALALALVWLMPLGGRRP
jgi:hypothetical protein